jgi:hypothetical protein
MDSNQQFDRLKQKFAPVLKFADEHRIALQTLNIQDNKLLIRVVVPSEEMRGRFMKEIERIDPSFNEVDPDVRVEAVDNVPNTGQTIVNDAQHLSHPPEKQRP